MWYVYTKWYHYVYICMHQIHVDSYKMATAQGSTGDTTEADQQSKTRVRRVWGVNENVKEGVC